jgi:hypothetical protein
MSSQGPAAANQTEEIQGDASNWTQLLKRRKIFETLAAGGVNLVKPNLRQSNQLQIDYRLGIAKCIIDNPYPKLRTGQSC